MKWCNTALFALHHNTTQFSTFSAKTMSQLSTDTWTITSWWGVTRKMRLIKHLSVIWFRWGVICHLWLNTLSNFILSTFVCSNPKSAGKWRIYSRLCVWILLSSPRSSVAVLITPQCGTGANGWAAAGGMRCSLTQPPSQTTSLI